MNMKKRQNSFFIRCAFAGGLLPLMRTPLIGSIHFKDEAGDENGGENGGGGSAGGAPPATGSGEGGGDGGDNGGDNGGGNNPPPSATMVPRSQLRSAITKRQKATSALKQVLSDFGIDADDCEFAGTGTDDDPYRIANLEQLKEDAGLIPNKPAKKGALSADAKKEKKRADALQVEAAALREFITKNMLRAEIRAAAREHGAFDGDNGEFKTVVKLVEPLYTVSVVIDEETGKASTVYIGRDDETGDELTDAQGNPLPPRGMVARLLATEKTLKVSAVRGGPGAGGNRIGEGNGNHRPLPGKETPEVEVRKMAGSMFGNRRPIR